MPAPSDQRGRFSETPSAPPERRYRVVLSEFDDGSNHFRVELRSDDLCGTEVLVFENDELLRRRRFFTHEFADPWSEAVLEALMRFIAH